MTGIIFHPGTCPYGNYQDFEHSMRIRAFFDNKKAA